MKNIDEPKPGPLKSFFRRRTGYGPVSAILVVLFAFFFSQVFAVLLISSAAQLFGTNTNDIFDKIQNSTEVQFIYTVIAQGVILYIIWVFLKSRAVPWSKIGLGRKPNTKDIAPSLIVFAIYFAVLIAGTAILQGLVPGIDIDQKQQLGFDTAVSPAQLVMVFISLVILPPFVEEILIRGFLYTGLRAKFTKIIAAVVASVIFGIAHLQLGSGAPPLWIAAFDTTILSLFLIYLRERTGALWAGMLVHFLKNGLAFMILFVVR